MLLPSPVYTDGESEAHGLSGLAKVTAGKWPSRDWNQSLLDSCTVLSAQHHTWSRPLVLWQLRLGVCIRLPPPARQSASAQGLTLSPLGTIQKDSQLRANQLNKLRAGCCLVFLTSAKRLSFRDWLTWVQANAFVGRSEKRLQDQKLE